MDIEDIVKQALVRTGEANTQGKDTGLTQAQTQDTERLITDCVLEVVQMSCYNIKQLADIRRTIRNVFKALVKEKDYITLGVIKRYVDARNRALVKSILTKASDVGLVITMSVEDTVVYKLNHQHAEEIFAYLERTT